MRALARFTPGSEVIFDYSQPREALPPVERWMLDSLSARVALAGEPFQLFFTPPQLAEELEWLGMRVVEDPGWSRANRTLSGRAQRWSRAARQGRTNLRGGNGGNCEDCEV